MLNEFKIKIDQDMTDFQSWDDALLFLIAHHSRGAVVSIVCTIATIFLFSYNFVPSGILYTWLVISLLGLLNQSIVARRISSDISNRVFKKKLIAVTGLISGSCLALATWFLLYLEGFSFIGVNFILVCICVGSILTTIGDRLCLAAFVAPISIGFFTALNAKSGQDNFLNFSTLGLVIAYFGVIVYFITIGDYVRNIFKSSYYAQRREGETNAKLKKALEVSEQANKDKTRFLAAASHDLRQPINALSLFSSVLSMQDLDTKLKEVAGHIEVATDALVNQLDSLLDISKLDAGVIQKTEEVFDLHQDLHQLYKQSEAFYSEREVNFSFDAKIESRAVVNTDRYLLERILSNLISNAFKYTDRGFIRLTISEHQQVFWVCVEDSGMGIDESEQEKIFNEFYQVNNLARDRSEGLGLGLSIVKRLCDLLDFEIHMRSKINQGTLFSIAIPKIKHSELAVHSDKTLHTSALNLKVLVIEDDLIVSDAMAAILSEMGHDYACAKNTEQAILLLEEFSPDIALIDYRLPNGDNGLKAVRALRSVIPDLLVIIITGDTAPEQLQEINAAGLQVLHKPVRANKLREALKNNIEFA